MSYVLAVWEGPAPADDAAAETDFEGGMALAEAGVPPTPAMRRYVDTLAERYPDVVDLPEDEMEASPWETSPPIAHAAGSFFHIDMPSSAPDAALEFFIRTALDQGLVVFDAQDGRVVTDWS
jgi:hypothetical protein